MQEKRFELPRLNLKLIRGIPGMKGGVGDLYLDWFALFLGIWVFWGLSRVPGTFLRSLESVADSSRLSLLQAR